LPHQVTFLLRCIYALLHYGMQLHQVCGLSVLDIDRPIVCVNNALATNRLSTYSLSNSAASMPYGVSPRSVASLLIQGADSCQ
jgi:hypothetical protein